MWSLPIQLSIGPEGPSRWQKATSPPQELEVGARRVPYLLVFLYFNSFFHIEYGTDLGRSSPGHVTSGELASGAIQLYISVYKWLAGLCSMHFSLVSVNCPQLLLYHNITPHCVVGCDVASCCHNIASLPTVLWGVMLPNVFIPQQHSPLRSLVPHIVVASYCHTTT